MKKKWHDWNKLMGAAKKTVVFVVLALCFVFMACNKAPAPLTDLNTITTYLSKAKGGTLEKPVSLLVSIPLGDLTDSGSGWQRLLTIIENTGKNVALDLSACQIIGTEFNPVNKISTGKFFIISLELPTAAKSIAAGNNDTPSFAHFYNLKTISAKELTSVGRIAFSDNASLINVNFPVAAGIGESAFYGCTNLASASIPLVSTIGESAFYGCTNLASANIPLATTIGTGAFAVCTNLTKVTFPASAAIAANPFYRCSNLTSFTLTGSGDLSVIEDGKALVRNGTDLIAYPSASGNIVMDAITTIGTSACSGSTNLTSVSFPAATTIGNWAFYGCTSLTSASFPTVASIGTRAFENTGTTMFTVTLGDKAPTIGRDMFAGITGEKPVTIRVPSEASGYTQTLIRTLSSQNSNINFTFEEFTTP